MEDGGGANRDHRLSGLPEPEVMMDRPPVLLLAVFFAKRISELPILKF